jgi:hypothetical protein
MRSFYALSTRNAQLRDLNTGAMDRNVSHLRFRHRPSHSSRRTHANRRPQFAEMLARASDPTVSIPLPHS